MALSGAFNGTFSGTSGAYPRIEWSGVQSIAGNYTDVTVNLRFIKTSSWAWNLNNTATGNININGDYSTSIINFDLRDPHTNVLVRTRTVRVNHNSDGTKTCFLGADGNTQVSWGTYNFSQTVTLDTIPREAYVTNSVNFTVGNNIPLTIWNGGNFWVQSQLYVNGNLIKQTNHGQVTSATITLDSTNNDAIYAQMPNATSVSMYVRIRTFSNSGYSSQIGSNKDKTGTVSINQAINQPTFTTFTLSNVDKSVVVKDKYDNTLVTSSTETLVDSSTKIIKGYSKVRARITPANKMVALNSATPVKYRLASSALQVEQNYSDDSNVDLELDNVTVNEFSVTAFDSRNLTTSVADTFSFMANYSPISIFNITLVRDNNVDTPTKLSFEGLIWNKYFDTGTDSGEGVLNTLTAHYRFKETTASWASQTWNEITGDVAIDSNGNISYEEYIDGDLGVSGFDSSKSYSIEIRLFDKLSQTLVERTLSVGIPLMDFVQAGVAVNAKYDEGKGGALQVNDDTYINGSLEVEEDTEVKGVLTSLEYKHLYTFSAYRGNSTQSIANSTWTDLIFDNEEYDPSNLYNTSTGRFVAPVSGLYLLTGSHAWSSNNSGIIQSRFINNTPSPALSYGYVYRAVSAVGNDVVSNVAIAWLDEGDSISYSAWHNFGSARNIQAATDRRNRFGAYLIST